MRGVWEQAATVALGDGEHLLVLGELAPGCPRHRGCQTGTHR